jgi:hypothetical protein
VSMGRKLWASRFCFGFLDFGSGYGVSGGAEEGDRWRDLRDRSICKESKLSFCLVHVDDKLGRLVVFPPSVALLFVSISRKR